MDDLYQRQVGQFTTPCGGNDDKDGNSESCVLSAPLAGGGVALRDTKKPGIELRFTDAEMRDYVTKYAHEHGITL